MSTAVRLTAFVLFVFALGLALPLAAQAQYREFSGKVDRISGSQLMVDNRQGDKLKFAIPEDVNVSGEKTELGDIRKGDWVSVDWKMMDNPRKAYNIRVLPPKEDE